MTSINLNRDDFEDYKSFKKEYDRQYSLLTRARRRELYAQNREHKLTQQREYRKNNPQVFKKVYEKRNLEYKNQGESYKQAITRGWLKANIKFFENTFEKYKHASNCELCNKKFGEIGGKSRHNKKALDHDHRSGYARFICCYSCNTFLRGRDSRLAEVHLELYRNYLR